MDFSSFLSLSQNDVSNCLRDLIDDDKKEQGEQSGEIDFCSFLLYNSFSTAVEKLGIKRKQRSELDDNSGSLRLKVQRLTDDARIPTRGSSQAAGYDLFAAADGTIPSRGQKLIKTDLAIAIPNGYYGRIAPRSGLSLKGLDVMAGVVDADYRGNVGVILMNHSLDAYEVSKGDKIAQLILTKILCVPVEEETLTETERGKNGFGSTGK